MDLANRDINITRSYEYDSTKGNREDKLPIPESLVPFLRAAIAASPNELVFPTTDGRMFSRDTKLNFVVRRGLARAGVVIGYDHICRRPGCGYRVRHQDAEPRWCPDCEMKLWLRAIPKRTRFHDLRHTTATLLLKEGVPMGVVQKILRHSDITVTEGTYCPSRLRRCEEGSRQDAAHRGRGTGPGHARVSPWTGICPGSRGGFCGEITPSKIEGPELGGKTLEDPALP